MSIFTARYASTCSKCGKTISPGQYISWVRKRGTTYHASCATPDAIPGNVALLGETKKALKVKEAFYKLQDASADAYWTDEMESAMRGAVPPRKHDAGDLLWTGVDFIPGIQS